MGLFNSQTRFFHTVFNKNVENCHIPFTILAHGEQIGARIACAEFARGKIFLFMANSPNR